MRLRADANPLHERGVLAAKTPVRLHRTCHTATFAFLCFVMSGVLNGAPDAVAQADAPVHPAQKPQPDSPIIAVTASPSAPVLGMKGRFHLSRVDGKATVSPLGPVTASIRNNAEPFTISSDKAAEPLLTLAVSDNGAFAARVHVQELDVRQADLRLLVENIKAHAMVGEEETAIDLVSMRLRPLNLPYWSVPVDLVARGVFKAGTLTLHGTTTSADGRVVAALHATVPTREATGLAEFRLEPIAFVPGGLQPAQLAPALAASLTAVRGIIAASGMIRWSGDEPAISGKLSLGDLSFTAGTVGVENLSGTITFESIWPPRTLPGQVLSVGRIGSGLEVTNGIVRFQFDDRGRLQIEQAEVDFSGGRLSLEPVTLDPNANSHDLVLRAQRLNLQEVLDAANVEAASASGHVSGRIPVTLSREGIAVTGAILAADARGFLRYRPSVPPTALQQEDSSIKLLRSVLTNFQYDRFSVTLDGGSGSEWKSAVHVAGNNPDVLEGHPFILNVNATVVPGGALVELGGERLSLGDTLPLYNALFGLGLLEWLGEMLVAVDDLTLSPAQ